MTIVVPCAKKGCELPATPAGTPWRPRETTGATAMPRVKSLCVQLVAITYALREGAAVKLATR